MELTSKIAGTIIACLSVASTIFSIVLLRWLYVTVQVKGLREEIKYLRGELEYEQGEIEKKDKLVVELREEMKRIAQRAENIKIVLDEDHREMVRRSAQILALREYIERMEVLCRRANVELPKPDRARWEPEEVG